MPTLAKPPTPAEPVFVFGSNLSGRHGRGAAAFARRWRGARYGVGEGATGNAYALPTKDNRLRTLPLDVIGQSVERFITHAAAHPRQKFEVTRVGCGLAGYTDTEVAPLFFAAPSNCTLPYIWERMRNADATPRVIIAGSRAFTDAALAECAIAKWTARFTRFTIVSGGARGADAIGAAYGHQHGHSVDVIPADWNRYGRAAGMLRNQHMSWSASHLIAFWDGASPGTRHMIETARRDLLQVRTCLF